MLLIIRSNIVMDEGSRLVADRWSVLDLVLLESSEREPERASNSTAAVGIRH